MPESPANGKRWQLFKLSVVTQVVDSLSRAKRTSEPCSEHQWPLARPRARPSTPHRTRLCCSERQNTQACLRHSWNHSSDRGTDFLCWVSNHVRVRGVSSNFDNHLHQAQEHLKRGSQPHGEGRTQFWSRAGTWGPRIMWERSARSSTGSPSLCLGPQPPNTILHV